MPASKLRIAVGLFLLAAVTWAGAQAQAPAPQPAVAIKAGRLITGTGSPILENAVIVVRGQRIEAVGPASSVTIPADARVVDLGSDTVMPGVIDAHAHLSIRPDIRTLEGQLEGMTHPDAKQMARIVRDIRVQLLTGVTALYVVGEVHYNDIYTAEAVSTGVIVGPRVYPSGNFISTTAGHGPAEYRTTNGPWAMRTFVRQNYEAGAHHMKLTVTDRARVGPNDGTPYAAGQSNYTKEEIEAAIDELHRLGIQATAHANGESIRLALEAGVDSIQHGGGLTEELIGLFLKYRKGFVNTYTIGFQGVFQEWQYLDLGANSAADWVNHCREVHRKAQENPRRMESARTRRAQLKMAKDRGVMVGIGTDSMHGLMPLEMENLVLSGFTPMEAILAATGVNAKIVGIDKDVGTLEKGKFADIISIKGRPDQDIRDITKVNFIMVGGRDHTGISFR